MAVRHVVPDRAAAFAKRQRWVAQVCMNIPLKEPFWPLGDILEPPNIDPDVVSKRTWEKQSSDWLHVRRGCYNELNHLYND